MKKETKRETRTSGRIGGVPLAVEIIEADSEVGVASVVAGEASAVAEEASAVAMGVSVVASEGASGIVIMEMALEEEGVEVSGVGVVEEIGEDLGKVLTAQLAREILEVKRSADSRRRSLSNSEKKRS